MKPLLSVEDISFSYPLAVKGGPRATPALPVLHHVSLSVGPGELIAVVGPSGCGKTTLLNLVAGLIRPTEGHIYFADSLSDGRRRSAYVFQSPRLVPWLSVQENALLGAELGGTLTNDLRHRCDERLAAYGLNGFEQSLPHTLSGGMQQRVSLLRALLSGAKLLLLDEPFVNSDFILQRQLQEELSNAVTNRELIGVLVTHELAQAVRLADEILVLSGRPAEIIDKFRISIDRDARLRGEPAALRDLPEYMTRLEQAVSRSRKIEDGHRA